LARAIGNRAFAQLVARERVNVTKHIRGSDSPEKASDRVSLEEEIPVSVETDAPIMLTVAGSGGHGGAATVGFKERLALSESGRVTLKGTEQTSDGNARGLRVSAERDETQIATSEGFSVAAIPKNCSFTKTKDLEGETRGFEVSDDWKSDSGARGISITCGSARLCR
jgi:hypothetical protein